MLDFNQCWMRFNNGMETVSMLNTWRYEVILSGRHLIWNVMFGSIFVMNLNGWKYSHYGGRCETDKFFFSITERGMLHWFAFRRQPLCNKLSANFERFYDSIKNLFTVLQASDIFWFTGFEIFKLIFGISRRLLYLFGQYWRQSSNLCVSNYYRNAVSRSIETRRFGILTSSSQSV